MAAGSNGRVAVAVSGGSDSLALLKAADVWAKRSGRSLLIMTVDHGLRTESAQEAGFVAERANALGHPATILQWKPDKRSQEAARQARHKLLAKACRKAGAQCLLLGHTRSDVEETLLMRLARPTTLSAAVGPLPVSVSPVWPEGRGLVIARPLIAMSRIMLRAQLAGDGENWVEDPSNESEAYERVRVRKLMGQMRPDRLNRITGDAMRLRGAEDRVLADLAESAVRVDPSGLVEIDLRMLPEAARPCVRLLALVLQLASGADRPVGPSPLKALLAELRGGGPASRLTLGGCWLQRKGDTLLIGRDPGESRACWNDGVWDGRYEQAAAQSFSEDPPFLVRHAVPDTPWREIVSDRLTTWLHALRAGAALSAELAEPGVTIPVPASTTRPA